MRTIIIGDVHGCNNALNSLLEKVKPEAGKDRLVFLGDLFDRGPESREVFLTVQKLDEIFGENLILLRGNHEDYLLQPRLTRRQRMIWESVGRKTTVHSFQKAGETMESTVPWLRKHVRLLWKTEEFQCVHAGIMIDPPEANDLQTLIHDHDMTEKNLYSGKLTVTGHIALQKATWFAGDGETTEEIDDDEKRVLPEKGVLCIDTGCGKGGRLTAMVTDGKEYILKSEAEGQVFPA